MANAHQKGQIEVGFIRQNLRIIGIDEVGRGCLAGPVYAACAAIDYRKLNHLDDKSKALIRDSKTLSHRQRQSILPVLQNVCLEFAIGVASVAEIESTGIVPATFRAMARSFESLGGSYDLLLIDGNQVNPFISLRQETVIGGDGLCFAIAAASIIAKEARDTFMREAAVEFPHYGFQDNVGYGTRNHLAALADHGVSPLHRRTFAPIARYIEQAHLSNATS